MIHLILRPLSSPLIVILHSLLFVLLLQSSSIAMSSEPQKLMEVTSQQLLKAFIEKTPEIRKDPNVAHTLIKDNLAPNINFSIMSQWVLGANWKKASTQQKQEFIREFKGLVTKFYSKALLQYLEKNDLTEDIISFNKFRDDDLKDNYATVRSQINPPKGGEPIKVNYDFYHSKKTGKWQVYDVSVEGISLVKTYRSSFKQIIKQKGMNALLSELREKNSVLNNSTTKPQVAAKEN